MGSFALWNFSLRKASAAPHNNNSKQVETQLFSLPSLSLSLSSSSLALLATSHFTPIIIIYCHFWTLRVIRLSRWMASLWRETSSLPCDFLAIFLYINTIFTLKAKLCLYFNRHLLFLSLHLYSLQRTCLYASLVFQGKWEKMQTQKTTRMPTRWDTYVCLCAC